MNRLWLRFGVAASFFQALACGPVADDQENSQRRRQVMADESLWVCADEHETAAIAALNSVRGAAGARPFLCHGLLRLAAENHANYLAHHDVPPGSARHAEAAGSLFFTGATLGARLEHAGIDRGAFWASEGVGGEGDSAEVIASHLATVYHRSHLLAPGGRYAAFAAVQGASRQQAVIASLADSDGRRLTPVRYPGRGQIDVPTHFGSARENPDPVPQISKPGHPISVHFPRYLDARTGREPPLSVEGFVLLDAGGRVVPAQLMEPSRDALLARADAVLVPLKPLQAASVYQVRARIRYGQLFLNEQWQFRTMASSTMKMPPAH